MESQEAEAPNVAPTEGELEEALMMSLSFLTQEKDWIAKRIASSGVLGDLPNQVESVKDEITLLTDTICAAFDFERLGGDDDSSEEVGVDDIEKGDESCFESVITSRAMNKVKEASRSDDQYVQLTDRLITNGRSAIYMNPTCDDKEYEVPIVAKNRDRLIGMYTGVKFMCDAISSYVDKPEALALKKWVSDVNPFSSLNFTNIVNKGEWYSENRHAKEYAEHLRYLLNYYESAFNQEDEPRDEAVMDKPPIHEQLMDVASFPFLEITCTNCMCVATIEEDEDVPHAPLTCSTCGSTLIDYTNVDVRKIIYRDPNLGLKKD